MRFIFFIFFFFVSLFAKAGDSSKLFGYSWWPHYQHPFFRLDLDTTAVQKQLRLEIVAPLKGVWSTLLPTYQLTGETNDVKVRVKYKSKDVQHFYVTLNSITNGARIARRDTITLPASPKWVETTSQLHLKHADLLGVSFEATGKKDTLGTIQLADFGVYADGKKLSNEVPDAEVAPLFQRSDLLNWTFGNYGNIPCMDSQILGIAETIHGTKTMNAVAMDMMKERILKHQCKLVMLELPMESIFYINRYVKNDPRFKFSHISNYIDNSLLGEPTKAFIEWLKQYNATHDNSVSLLGFDTNAEWLRGQVDLFDFFYTLNDGKKSPEMINFCKAVLQDMRPFSKRDIAALLDSSEVVKSCLQKDELLLVRKSIRLMQWFAKRPVRYSLRDRLMAQFTQFAIDSVFPKETAVTMYAHTGHLNYSQATLPVHLNYFSAGHYLKEKYGENYRCIDIATYQGATIVSGKYGAYAGGKLAAVPQRSLEYQLGQLGVDSVYLPMSKLQSSEALQMRMAGNGSIKVQFIYCYPQTRVDGVLFVRNVEPVIKSERVIKGWQEGARPMFNAYKEALDKMKAM
ncbi:hypothetical protein HMPREF2955_09175 [Prevotella sp. HMSC073D09]|uniref:erythromycin esterase family protein n=1 Tax=Prevotella sp. HMSC073D09 TaxID=1739459 RepID=UPI0008A25A31|nr:erythromycin esterase family protein [Prevotella sp. HMSC073D09]OFQ19642.1 hypothetical protein HMPREF2955_09175 [Prevotella sp. HMSC073D09]